MFEREIMQSTAHD